MTPHLFIGFELTSPLQEALAHANPYRLSLFTGGGDYLQWITWANNRYLGKYCPYPATFDYLENFESHVRSLFSQLIPSSLLKEKKSIFLTLLDVSPFEINFPQVRDQ